MNGNIFLDPLRQRADDPLVKLREVPPFEGFGVGRDVGRSNAEFQSGVEPARSAGLCVP